MLVEVAVSSLHYDRTRKLALYARSGIPQYWLVDVAAGVVEVYRLDAPGTYGEPERLTGDDAVTIDALPGVSVTVTEILG